MTPPTPADVHAAVIAIAGALLREHPGLDRYSLRDIQMLASLPWELNQATARRFGMTPCSLKAWVKRVGWRHGLVNKEHDRRTGRGRGKADTYVLTPAGQDIFKFAQGTTTANATTTHAPGTTTPAT